ncbi:Reverse transcriptase domain [Trinorchestia longiramus]|nr:Reverse transcriptase domain [Trinorchestia longiramus]
MNTNSLQQPVNEPTRRSNILDLVMTTPDLSINALEFTDTIGEQTPNNYRSISLTSVISKTIERQLKVRITKHLNDQNLITDTQHGFREKSSCLTNLLDFFGEFNRIYDCTKAVDLVYLDFQKAFDKVPHERLMAKVEVHGIRGNYSRWI